MKLAISNRVLSQKVKSNKELFNIRLVHDSKLIAVMGLSNLNGNNYELMVYESIDIVIGGATKLFNFFVNGYKPDTVIGYSNRCWPDKIYTNLGFDNITKDDYNTTCYHVKRNWRLSQNEFDALPESEKSGYFTIYNCGYYIFKWSKEKAN